jgi:hypothetical protein
METIATLKKFKWRREQLDLALTLDAGSQAGGGGFGGPGFTWAIVVDLEPGVDITVFGLSATSST